MQRNNAYDLVVQAIQDLVDAVKGYSTRAYPLPLYPQWSTKPGVKNSLRDTQVIYVT